MFARLRLGVLCHLELAGCPDRRGSDTFTSEGLSRLAGRFLARQRRRRLLSGRRILELRFPFLAPDADDLRVTAELDLRLDAAVFGRFETNARVDLDLDAGEHFDDLRGDI